MTALNKQALREAAEKATPGRIGDRIDGSNSIKYECHGYDGSLVLRTDHKNMEYGFIGDNSNADELFFRLCVPDVILALLDELEAEKNMREAAEKRIAELEARTPYGYLRQCDGQIQISIGSEQPHNRSGGYATPWFAIYTAAGIGVKGE